MDAFPGIQPIERVYNRLRWKYLRAIHLSPALREAPFQAISARYNGAFLTLAGLAAHTTPGEPEREQHRTWEQRGFAPAARHELAWHEERAALAAALQSLAQTPLAAAAHRYAEVIALKPGFHEAWLHDDFPNDAYEGPESQRGRVFAILRGGREPLLGTGEPVPSDALDPDRFLGYAPCAVTEGPFVRRRSPEVSYFTELQRVGGLSAFKARHTILRESFEVLDPWQRLHDRDDRATLEHLIAEAEAFIAP